MRDQRTLSPALLLLRRRRALCQPRPRTAHSRTKPAATRLPPPSPSSALVYVTIRSNPARSALRQAAPYSMEAAFQTRSGATSRRMQPAHLGDAAAHVGAGDRIAGSYEPKTQQSRRFAEDKAPPAVSHGAGLDGTALRSGSMASKQRSVLYVDFGFTSAKEFWREVGLPAYDRFKANPNRQTAIEASLHAWHVHEWVWHDANRDMDTKGPAYDAFRDALIAKRPELAWVRDIADAGKHRGLSRQKPLPVVKGVSTGDLQQLVGGDGSFLVDSEGRYLAGPGDLEIKLTGGKPRQAATVLATVIAFWEAHFGP